MPGPLKGRLGLFLLFMLAGGLLLLSARYLQTPSGAEITQAQQPLLLHVAPGEFARYCLEMDVDMAQLDDGERLQYFRNFAEQEMLFQQALREGLVWRDPVVQRLVISNQEFLGVEQMNAELLEELVLNDIGIRRHVVRRARHILSYIDVPEPDEAVLREYHTQHSDLFASIERVDLSQRVYAARQDAVSALELVRTTGSFQGVGAASGLPVSLVAAGQQDIGRYFGYAFAQQVLEMAAMADADTAWTGPLESQFGYHLVKLENYRPSGTVPFGADIKDKVLGLWRNEQREIAYEQRIQVMKSQLLVSIEGSEPELLMALSADGLKKYF